MEGIEVAAAIEELIVAHHDAFSVELLGEEGSGLPKERIEQLVTQGFLQKNQKDGMKIGSMDVVETAQRISHSMNQTPPEERDEKRKLSLSQWKQILDKARDQGARRSTSEAVSMPSPPPTPVTKVSPSGQVTFTREPVDFTQAEKASYRQAVNRSGEFARGLGNRIAEGARPRIIEVWDGAQIELEADPKLRQEMQTVIREKVSQAVVKRQSAKKLASELGNATKDWARDWNRIARTELQATYNEGTVIESIEIFGDEARVARIPESDACEHCLRLFLDEENLPIIFQVADLLSRGTNVGRKRDQWQATMFPIHPWCRCDTQIVPPGLRFDKDGLFVPEGE